MHNFFTMSSVNIVGYVLPNAHKLNGKNYVIWKFKIFYILALKKLTKIVEGKEPKLVVNPTQTATRITSPTPTATGKDVEDWEDHDREALAIIGLSDADDLITHLQGKTSSTNAWQTLKDLYETKNETRVLYLRNLLYSFKMTVNDSISSHVQTFKGD
eukprot:Gb_19202 [translate_table: standard]